jgi:hypothetical protein
VQIRDFSATHPRSVSERRGSPFASSGFFGERIRIRRSLILKRSQDGPKSDLQASLNPEISTSFPYGNIVPNNAPVHGNAPQSVQGAMSRS